MVPFKEKKVDPRYDPWEDHNDPWDGIASSTSRTRWE